MAREDFADAEYRQEFARSFVAAQIATQIRILRRGRRLTQEDLAIRAGMRQSRISAMEDVNYSAWSVRTLQRLAEALDVALSIRFESYGDILRQSETVTRASLAVPSFAEDPAFLTVGATTAWAPRRWMPGTLDSSHELRIDRDRLAPADIEISAAGTEARRSLDSGAGTGADAVAHASF